MPTKAELDALSLEHHPFFYVRVLICWQLHSSYYEPVRALDNGTKYKHRVFG